MGNFIFGNNIKKRRQNSIFQSVRFHFHTIRLCPTFYCNLDCQLILCESIDGPFDLHRILCFANQVHNEFHRLGKSIKSDSLAVNAKKNPMTIERFNRRQSQQQQKNRLFFSLEGTTKKRKRSIIEGGMAQLITKYNWYNI